MARDLEVLDGSTYKGSSRAADDADARLPVMTILAHPDMSRIGEVAWLDTHARTRVGRLGPAFAALHGGPARPLADMFLSRQPFDVFAAGDDLVVHTQPAGSPVRVDGGSIPLAGARTFARSALNRGIVLELAERVVLLLHLRRAPPSDPPPSLGLVGESDALDELRRTIALVADVRAPVLVRGETGSGKELVAQAIHAGSPRAGEPLVALSLAAVPAGTAASELFGHVRGAFSGADRDWEGRFVQAHGGTLFLDEIGEAPLDLQVLLLRALETLEVMPVGGARTRRVDVRLVAATDADIEGALAAGRFRAPLYHRLASYPVEVPPLRAHVDDIGRLLRHFLFEELDGIGEAERLATPARDQAPWLPARLVARLACHHWPGNVRELRNVARQIAIGGRGRRVAPVDLKLGASPVLDRGDRGEVEPAMVPERRPPRTIGDDELVAVLRSHAFQPSAAAKALGISRTTLDALIDRSERLRKVRDISTDEIRRALEENDGNTRAAALRLEVSARALELRLREIGRGS